MLLTKLHAFIHRDWLDYGSLRLNVLFSLGNIFLTVVPFFFVDRMMGPGVHPELRPYGGDYFAFVLVGLAFSRYLGTAVSGLAGRLREDQIQGSLEAMLATPTPPSLIALGSIAWEFLWTSLEVLLYLIVGILVFGADLSRVNLPAAALILVMTIASLSSLGVLCASSFLLFKEGDPMGWALSGFMKLVGGVFFPIALLPLPVQAIAYAFPLTYGLDGLRRATLQGASLAQLTDVVVALTVFSLTLWPIAIISFNRTLRRLQRLGGLSLR